MQRETNQSPNLNYQPDLYCTEGLYQHRTKAKWQTSEMLQVTDLFNFKDHRNVISFIDASRYEIAFPIHCSHQLISLVFTSI